MGGAGCSSNCPDIPDNPPCIFLVSKNEQALFQTIQPTSWVFLVLCWTCPLTNNFSGSSRILYPYPI